MSFNVIGLWLSKDAEQWTRHEEKSHAFQACNLM